MPGLVFGRLWAETGCEAVVKQALEGRQFGFDAERVLFSTVLHRLCGPRLGPGVQTVDAGLRHRGGAEGLFARRRSLFSSLSPCFFDTTSITFEGEGGESIGQYGHSKDHRPDLRQMVVGAVLDGEGHPVCCEMWPGNTTDVKSLVGNKGYHKCDQTIRGHVFCSFLALVLRKALQEKIEAKGWPLEWADVTHDLKEVEEAEIGQDGKQFLMRLDNGGCSGKVFQTAGVAMPATLRQTVGQAGH